MPADEMTVNDGQVAYETQLQIIITTVMRVALPAEPLVGRPVYHSLTIF